jgi:hypothetical protein
MALQDAEIAQVYALLVGDTPPFELDISASAVEFLYVFGTPARELDIAASAVEFLYVESAAAESNVPVDPVAVGFLPGPVWQMAARQAGQN